jgi:hypothetical protein
MGCTSHPANHSHISSITANEPQTNPEFRAELNSHTDTLCVLDPGALTFHKIMRSVNVSPFSKTLGQMNHKPIVSGALAYDDPITGEVLLLVIHQAIYIEEITNHLLCPMQLCMNNITLSFAPRTPQM